MSLTGDPDPEAKPTGRACSLMPRGLGFLSASWSLEVGRAATSASQALLSLLLFSRSHLPSSRPLQVPLLPGTPSASRAPHPMTGTPTPLKLGQNFLPSLPSTHLSGPPPPTPAVTPGPGLAEPALWGLRFLRPLPGSPGRGPTRAGPKVPWLPPHTRALPSTPGPPACPPRLQPQAFPARWDELSQSPSAWPHPPSG